MSQERTLDSRLVYRGRRVNLRVDTVELPRGKTHQREVVEHSPCAAIVAIDAEGDVLLVRQFRRATGRMLLEIPAGGLEPGEEPVDCARRELEEETGYLAGGMEWLGGFYSSPGFCTEFLHLFLATDLRHAERTPEEDEDIELIPVPLTGIPDLIASGEICDAKSIAGLLLVMYRTKG